MDLPLGPVPQNMIPFIKWDCTGSAKEKKIFLTKVGSLEFELRWTLTLPGA